MSKEKKYVPRGLRAGYKEPEYNIRKKLIVALVEWACHKIGEEWRAKPRAVAEEVCS